MDNKICLDSDIIIEILKNNLELKNKLETISKQGDIFCTTSINVFETWFGRENNEIFLNFLEGLYSISFDEDSAKKAAVILNVLKKEGSRIEARDLFIAAICITNNLELLTNNKKHFERLKKLGLKLVDKTISNIKGK